jgi:hypothetical protein
MERERDGSHRGGGAGTLAAATRERAGRERGARVGVGKWDQHKSNTATPKIRILPGEYRRRESAVRIPKQFWTREITPAGNVRSVR